MTAGHPEHGHAPGIETTTGPLGQGLANAVGMALAERLLNARLGDGIVDHYTYVLVGDGCLMEGISHEAISLAGHLKLNKLIVLFDDNQVSIDGPTSLAVSDDQAMRFEASGWAALRVDGHDRDVIAGAIELARRSDRPTLIVCRTVIGYGAPTKQGTASTHGSPLGPEEVAGARGRLGWGYAPFEVPAHVLSAWRACGARGAVPREAWKERWQSLDAEVRAAVEHPARTAAPAVAAAIAAAKRAAAGATAKKATRAWSEATLEHLIPALPALIGGSADLTGSNNTKIKDQAVVSAGSFAGSYLHYGVREHAMAAVMNGMALHGGLIPYGGTFLVFSDYCRPAVRLSALMRQRVIYVMTHDSIGLGEDGPTHQPVEHLAALRAIPNLNVFRPADGVETAECWELAVRPGDTPSVLALTRQAVPNLRTAHTGENLCARGAYVLAETPARKRDITLLATGSEVGIAVEARALLAKDGIEAAVVSMPCWGLFAAQPAAHREAVLGSAPRVAVEAAVSFGWERWLGETGAFVGMRGFGASAPAAKLYEHFGITPAAVAAAARKLVASPPCL
jgi:transketolase